MNSANQIKKINLHFYINIINKCFISNPCKIIHRHRKWWKHGRHLEDQTGVVGDELGIARDTGETIRIAAVQAQTGAEADESDLIVCAIGLNEAQWATRVTLLQTTIRTKKFIIHFTTSLKKKCFQKTNLMGEWWVHCKVPGCKR